MKSGYESGDKTRRHVDIASNGAGYRRNRCLTSKENVFPLGEYPALSLADARKARDDAKQLVKQGTNPAHSRKLDRLTAANASRDTFEAVALEWSASRAVECKWPDSYGKG